MREPKVKNTTIRPVKHELNAAPAKIGGRPYKQYKQAMTHDQPEQPFIYLAPLKGITDALFRKVLRRHFSGVDCAMAPFINPQSQVAFSDKLISDLLPENNDGQPLIPQLLNTDGATFLALADRLFDLGYDQLNWNLGCPVRMVTKKKRGSGLLPYPDRIVALLDEVLPKLKQRLSIKMRLGYSDYAESAVLLPRLDPFPLDEIIIHARLGTQMYRGHASVDQFLRCLPLTRHPVVYNGDITSPEGFLQLAGQMKTVQRWMIGRGLLANPLLAAEIKGNGIEGADRARKLAAFHDELYESLRDRLSGPGHLLGRMKQVWLYFIESFPQQRKGLKKVMRANSEKVYTAAVDEILDRRRAD